jgi:hypothetical protein
MVPVTTMANITTAVITQPELGELSITIGGPVVVAAVVVVTEGTTQPTRLPDRTADP